MLGIRPEAYRRSRCEPVAGAVPVELDAVTPLNERAVLFCAAGDGEELLASVPSDDALRFGRGHRTVWARSTPERVLLFDHASGARLAPAAA